MELSSLFPVADEHETAKKTRNFLKNDLEGLLRLANKDANFLRSPSFDGMPKSASGKNSNENQVIEYVSGDTTRRALAVLNDVNKALSLCRHTHQVILYDRYVAGYSDKQVSLKLQYGRTRYHELKIAALNEFAERLKVQSCGIDLIVLK